MAALPQLYQWGARALYLGPALGLSPHRNAVAVIAAGLDGSFALARDPHAPSAGAHSCRAALIAPNTLHHLLSSGGRMAFLYVDALSTDLERLQASVGEWRDGAGFALNCEERLLDLFAQMDRGRADFVAARPLLEQEILGRSEARVDLKVRLAIEYLNRNGARRPTLEQLSAIAALSPSRFRHVFREATGVPLKRYRLWVAMGSAMRLTGQSKSLTEAAHAAGFSSSAHFSAAFRAMFGMEPSRLVRTGLEREHFAANAE